MTIIVTQIINGVRHEGAGRFTDRNKRACKQGVSVSAVLHGYLTQDCDSATSFLGFPASEWLLQVYSEGLRTALVEAVPILSGQLPPLCLSLVRACEVGGIWF